MSVKPSTFRTSAPQQVNDSEYYTPTVSITNLKYLKSAFGDQIQEVLLIQDNLRDVRKYNFILFEIYFSFTNPWTEQRKFRLRISGKVMKLKIRCTMVFFNSK
jgi:hypothetical protein